MSTFEEIVTFGKTFYSKWEKTGSVSPAFKETIKVNRLCWNHIWHKKRHSLEDKLIRTKKLPLAKEILETATTYQTNKIHNDYIYYGITAVKGNTRVKIVVSQRKTGKTKYLYSVMFKNLERAEQRKTWIHNTKIIEEFRRKNPCPKVKRRR